MIVVCVLQIAENERAEQEQQQSDSMMQGSGQPVYESVPANSQPYDRNFLSVNLLEPNHQYSRQDDQTALQLV